MTYGFGRGAQPFNLWHPDSSKREERNPTQDKRDVRGLRFLGASGPLPVCSCTLAQSLERQLLDAPERRDLANTSRTPHEAQKKRLHPSEGSEPCGSVASGDGVSDQYRPMMMTDDLRGLPGAWLCIMLWDFPKTLRRWTPEMTGVNYPATPVNVDSELV